MNNINSLLGIKINTPSEKAHPLTRFRGTNHPSTKEVLAKIKCFGKCQKESEATPEEEPGEEIDEREFDGIIFSAIASHSEEIRELHGQIEAAHSLYSRKELEKGYEDGRIIKYFRSGPNITYRVVENGRCGFLPGQN